MPVLRLALNVSNTFSKLEMNEYLFFWPQLLWWYFIRSTIYWNYKKWNVIVRDFGIKCSLSNTLYVCNFKILSTWESICKSKHGFSSDYHLFYNLSQNSGLLAQKMEEDCGSVPSSYSAKNKSWLPGLRKKKSGQNSNTM